MIQELAPIVSNSEIANGIFSLKFASEAIARKAAPGQFVNIRPTSASIPFLRRPFSIASLCRDKVEILFNVIGEGTKMLALKKPGDALDVVGPLGIPFGFKGSYETAIIVAGGLGVAPFPFLTQELKKEGKAILSIVGARTSAQLVAPDMEDVHFATDDGSKGFRGTVVGCLQTILKRNSISLPKIFGCGPTRMLQALSDFAEKEGIECELSLEGDMACGIGLCQGCPVKRRNGKRKYALVCTEGPTFNCRDIVLS